MDNAFASDTNKKISERGITLLREVKRARNHKSSMLKWTHADLKYQFITRKMASFLQYVVPELIDTHCLW